MVPEESRKCMSWTELGSFDGGERLRPREWLPYMPFPEVRTFLLFRNGVLRMSSDLRDSFWAYLT